MQVNLACLPISAFPPQSEIQQTQGLGNRKMERALRVPSFRRPPAAGNPENLVNLGNGSRKRNSGHCEIDKFAAFVGFPSLGWAPAPEIQGALETASDEISLVPKPYKEQVWAVAPPDERHGVGEKSRAAISRPKTSFTASMPSTARSTQTLTDYPSRNPIIATSVNKRETLNPKTLNPKS